MTVSLCWHRWCGSANKSLLRFAEQFISRGALARKAILHRGLESGPKWYSTYRTGLVPYSPATPEARE